MAKICIFSQKPAKYVKKYFLHIYIEMLGLFIVKQGSAQIVITVHPLSFISNVAKRQLVSLFLDFEAVP